MTTLRIEDLTVGYGESAVLHDVTLEVPAGKVVCLMGRNGVGKTTLMKSVMGVLRPNRGKIHLGEREITKLSPGQRARLGIGYLPQGRGIFPHLTVYENLLMGFEATPEHKPGSAWARESLEEVYTIFPVLRQMRNRVAGTLSGGQQQQLAFGRVLVRRPELLLLDEPTEGIQPSIMHEIEELILQLQQQGKMSILLVEQFLDFALNVGSHFYVMETGAIVMNAPAREFDANRARDYLAI
jgi:urea transport system ATP-binding protein